MRRVGALQVFWKAPAIGPQIEKPDSERGGIDQQPVSQARQHRDKVLVSPMIPEMHGNEAFLHESKS